jgi:tetratricopeptide (TPR) repeat protein
MLAAALPVPAQEEEGGRIDIEVQDAAGKGIADVEVRVSSAAGRLLLEGTTNKKGRFKGAVDRSGTHVLHLEKPGFGPLEREVEIRGGITMSGSLEMLGEAQYRKNQAVEAFNAGVTAIQDGNDKVALERFRESAELDPSIADAHRMVAAIGLETGQLDIAAPALESYLDLEGLDADIAPIAYEVFRRRGDARKREALEALRSAGGTAAADAARRVFNAGVEANRAGDREAAMAAWRDAVALDPSLAPAHQSLAALAFNDQDYETAIAHVERLLELEPGQREGLRMGFWCHAFLGHQLQARELGAQWLAAVDEAEQEILDEAERLFEENRLEDAAKLTELLVTLAPDHARGHYLLGRIGAGSGDNAAARTHLQRFIQLSPDDPEAYTARLMLREL